MSTVICAFETTEAALRFALRYASQQHSSSELAGLMHTSAKSGSGLTGTDGATQAGMVRAELAKLTPIQQAVITGRYALSDVPCTCGRPCCCGHVPNAEWTAAITLLARETAILFGGRMTYFRLRQTLIGNALLSVKATDASLARQFGVHSQTVADHASKIEAAILGTRSQLGEFEKAYARIDTLLHEFGIVGPAAIEQ